MIQCGSLGWHGARSGCEPLAAGILVSWASGLASLWVMGAMSSWALCRQDLLCSGHTGGELDAADMLSRGVWGASERNLGGFMEKKNQQAWAWGARAVWELNIVFPG